MVASLKSMLLPSPDRGRLAAAVDAVILLVAAAFFYGALLRDANDNAYLGIVLVAFFLIVTAVPFVMAAVTPARIARGFVAVGCAVAWVLGAMGTLVLIWSAVIIPSQNYPTNDQFVAYVAAAVLFPATIAAVLYLPRRNSIAGKPGAGVVPGGL